MKKQQIFMMYLAGYGEDAKIGLNFKKGIIT